jgi:ferritin
MITKKVEEAINLQIMKEEHSSRIYMAMASWCEAKGYPGAADFLFKQSDEERMHMLKFVKFLNDRGGYAVLSALEIPDSQYKSLRDVFDQVLAHEEFITASINELYEISLNAKDYTTGNFLQWYINEQIEEESTVHNILDRMKLVGDDKAGMFHIDKELEAIAAAKVIDPIA